MHVKICGITRLEDAVSAIQLGADMLGFNFYPRSKRYVTPAACAEMIAGLAAAGQTAVYVGIFVNATAAEIEHIMQDCGLHLAQLSGDETPQALQQLQGKGFKALRPQTEGEAASLVQQFAPYPLRPAFLIDAFHHGAYGGTGRTGNWTVAERFARQYALMLAGGLTPENVATAVAQVQPWGVDVASGVESAPGIKDAAKMRAFIANARHAGSK